MVTWSRSRPIPRKQPITVQQLDLTDIVNASAPKGVSTRKVRSQPRAPQTRVQRTPLTVDDGPVGGKRINAGMRRFWCSMTPEERSAHGQRSAASRRQNRLEAEAQAAQARSDRGKRAAETRARNKLAREQGAPAQHDGVIDTATPTLDTSPSPTIRDRRLILEALDLHYDHDKGLYRRDVRDHVLATTLNVPAAWVADLRENFCGGPDRNEAEDHKRAEEENIRAGVAALDEEVDEIASVIDGLLPRLVAADDERRVLKQRLQVLRAQG